MTGLEVLGQHQDADRLPELRSDLASGGESLHRMGRRHPDVHHRNVGTQSPDRLEQRVRLAHLGNDVEPLQPEELGDAGAQQHAVVGQHYPHGRSTSIRVPPPGGLTT